MKLKYQANAISEILEPLHMVADELSQVAEDEKNHTIEYTDLDVIAAAVVFTHVLSNRKAHNYAKTTDTTDFDQIYSEMSEYGARIGAIVKDMSNIDLNKKEDT